MALLWAILFLSFFCRFGTFCNYLQFIFLHLRQHLENKATRFHFYQVPLNQYIWSLNQMFITKNQDLADQRSLIIFLYHFLWFPDNQRFQSWICDHQSLIILLDLDHGFWTFNDGSWILIIQHLYFSLLHGREPLAPLSMTLCMKAKNRLIMSSTRHQRRQLAGGRDILKFLLSSFSTVNSWPTTSDNSARSRLWRKNWRSYGLCFKDLAN